MLNLFTKLVFDLEISAEIFFFQGYVDLRSV